MAQTLESKHAPCAVCNNHKHDRVDTPRPSVAPTHPAPAVPKPTLSVSVRTYSLESELAAFLPRPRLVRTYALGSEIAAFLPRPRLVRTYALGSEIPTTAPGVPPYPFVPNPMPYVVPLAAPAPPLVPALGRPYTPMDVDEMLTAPKAPPALLRGPCPPMALAPIAPPPPLVVVVPSNAIVLERLLHLRLESLPI